MFVSCKVENLQEGNLWAKQIAEATEKPVKHLFGENLTPFRRKRRFCRGPPLSRSRRCNGDEKMYIELCCQ